VDSAFSVGGAIHGFIVNSHQTGIAGQLQIGFDKSGAQGDRFLESGQGVFGRVTGGPAMSDQQHGEIPIASRAARENRYAAGALNEVRSTGSIVTSPPSVRALHTIHMQLVSNYRVNQIERIGGIHGENNLESHSITPWKFTLRHTDGFARARKATE
jgi:hypothetical protein